MKFTHVAATTLLCVTSCMTALGTARANASDSALPQYDKVVVVIEENTSYQQLIGNTNAPYLNDLIRHGALLSQSYGAEHPSEPNYLDLYSGADQNIYDDSHPVYNPFSEPNLGAQLLHHGMTFATFSEDLPYVGDTIDDTAAAPGDPPGTTDYVRKHNPVVNWQNDQFAASPDNPGSNYVPTTANQPLTPFTDLSNRLQFGKLPTVSFVVPNEQHDGHGVSGGSSGQQLIKDTDAWLKNNISTYATWAKYHNSLLIVTYDEDDYAGNNHVVTVFYGARVKTGVYPEAQSVTYVSTVNAAVGPQGAPRYRPEIGVNHWNVLRTIEDIYGLGHAGQADKVDTISDLFE